MKQMSEIRIDYNQTYIYTTLLEADSACSKPALAIVIHGLTGCMDEQQLIAVRDAANRAGMAVMCIDLFGHGKSGGGFYGHSVSLWVDQIECVVDFARKTNRYSDIYLIGHSQGGLATILAASRIKDLKAIVLMAPAICIVTEAREGKFFGELISDIKNPGDLTFWDDFTISGNYLKDAMGLPLEDAIGNVDTPVLIVHGTNDESVPFDDSVGLEKKFKNAKLIPIEGDTHCFDNKSKEMAEYVYDFLVNIN